jgi:hypothetical protein
VGVPLVATNLIDRALGEAHHMKRVKADLSVGNAVADRFGVAAGHVDRDRADRLFAVAELVEEALQCLGVAACGAPHDRAAVMVDDACEIALAAAVADLITADRDEAAEAPLVELVCDDAGDDLPDGGPADPEQPGDLRLGHLLGQPRDDVLEVAGVLGVGSRPRHGLQMDPARRAAQAAQLTLDHTPRRGEIEVAPALDATPMDLQLAARLPAPRADPPPASQPDGHDDRLRGNGDVDDRCAAQTQQPVECRGDAHVVLLVSRLPSNSPQPAGRGDGASPNPRKSQRVS